MAVVELASVYEFYPKTKEFKYLGERYIHYYHSTFSEKEDVCYRGLKWKISRFENNVAYNRMWSHEKDINKARKLFIKSLEKKEQEHRDHLEKLSNDIYALYHTEVTA